MVGGAYELTANYYKEGNEEVLNNGKSFTNIRNNKYVTAYGEENFNDSYKIGDALEETKGWNGDDAQALWNIAPYFNRGGCCTDTSIAGIFCFGRVDGSADGSATFRLGLKLK